MDNRIFVHVASGSGGGGKQTLGQADAALGMLVKFHNLNCGPGSTENEISPSDALAISAFSNDIISATGLTSGKLYSDYSFYTSVSSTDPVLTQTGVNNWPTGTSPKHYPYL